MYREDLIRAPEFPTVRIYGYLEQQNFSRRNIIIDVLRVPGSAVILAREYYSEPVTDCWMYFTWQGTEQHLVHI